MLNTFRFLFLLFLFRFDFYVDKKEKMIYTSLRFYSFSFSCCIFTDIIYLEVFMDLLVIGAKQKDFNLLPKNQINLKDFDYSMLGSLELKQGDFISALVSEDVFF